MAQPSLKSAVHPGKPLPTVWSSAAVLLLFALVAVALKITTFGDPNRHVDETFYFLVGQRMHEGLLPYVDVWDRKPLGLFLIYYLITGISASVLGYQIVACLFAALTAFVICMLARRWAGWQGGVYAGLAYLFILGPFEGDSGHAPDFYNLFMASAAFLIAAELEGLLRGRQTWRSWTAMALCGLAITIKQTTLFESAFFGLCVACCLFRAGTPLPRIAAVVAISCLLGALPMLLIAGFYWQAGHWHEFWHAMVISNLVKAKVGGEAWRVVGIAVRAAILIVFAVWGLLGASIEKRDRIFLVGWILASLIGFVSVPNFYGHYTLPVLVPLSVCSGLLFGRNELRRVLLVGFVLYALLWYNPIQYGLKRESDRSMTEMAEIIREHDPGGGLFVFDGPLGLYWLTGERFLSPLVFPNHLNHQIENNVSHLNTHAEVDRILAKRPGVVVVARYPTSHPVNAYSRARVLDYAKRSCPFSREVTLQQQFITGPIIIFGDCR